MYMGNEEIWGGGGVADIVGAIAFSRIHMARNVAETRNEFERTRFVHWAVDRRREWMASGGGRVCG